MYKRVISNWILLILSSVFSMILNFFTTIYLGKKLSIDEFGMYSTYIALVSLIATFINNFACGTVLNRELSAIPKSGKFIVKKFVSLRLIAYVMTSIVLYIYQVYSGEKDEIIIISILLLLFANVSWEMFEQIAFGYKVTKLSSLINVISAAIWLIVVFIIPLEKTSIQSIFSIYVLIMIIKSIVYGITDYSRIIQTGENCKISYIDILSNSSSYLWMRMIGTISTQFSVVLLDNKVGSEEVAYYSVGNKFTMPVGIMITTGVNAFFPYLTEFYHKNKNEYNRILSIVLAIVLTFGSLTAMLLSITSHIWLVTIMGEKYSGAVAAFNYQIWYTVCLVFDTVLSMIMSTSYKQKLLAVITTIDTLIYIPVLYYSVSFGASGMAIGKLIAAALSVSYHIVLMYFLLERKLKMQTLILTISYSVALFLTYLLVETMINQIIIVLMITIFLTIIPQSPIRQGLNLFYEIYNSKFKNFKC